MLNILGLLGDYSKLYWADSYSFIVLSFEGLCESWIGFCSLIIPEGDVIFPIWKLRLLFWFIYYGAENFFWVNTPEVFLSLCLLLLNEFSFRIIFAASFVYDDFNYLYSSWGEMKQGTCWFVTMLLFYMLLLFAICLWNVLFDSLIFIFWVLLSFFPTLANSFLVFHLFSKIPFNFCSRLWYFVCMFTIFW